MEVVAKPCAFRDCGDPSCHLCALAKIPTAKVNAAAADGLRERAKAEPKAAAEKPLWMPKKRHRVGPHR